MGICELPSLGRNTSIAFEDLNNKNLIRYLRFPKGEHFYLKNHIKFHNEISPSSNQLFLDELQLTFAFNFTKASSERSQKSYKIAIYPSSQSNQQLTETNIINPNENGDLIFNEPVHITYHFKLCTASVTFKLIENNESISEVECSLLSLVYNNELSCEMKEGNLKITTNKINKKRKIGLFKIDLSITSKLNMNTKVSNMSEYSTKMTNDRCYFYLLQNSLDGSTWKKLYKSNEFCHTEFMNSFELNTDVLCLCDKNKQIKIEIYEVVKPPLAECVQENPNKDIESTTLSEPLAYEILSLTQIEETLKTQNTFSCLLNQPKTPNDINKKIIPSYYPYQYSDLGGSIDNIYKMSITYIENDFTSFTELIKNTIEIKTIIGIDCSNDQSQQNTQTTKYVNSTKYIIKNICDVLMKYNKDKEMTIPSYGFGGNVNNKDDIKVFPLAVNTNDINIKTIDKVITEYESVITQVKCAENNNTNLCDVIQEMTGTAKSESNTNYYYVIVITLKKGNDNDIKQLKNIIVQLADYPVSLVVVGLNNGDINTSSFEGLRLLDNEEFPIYNEKGDKIKRDIFQFKEINVCDNNNDNNNKVIGDILNEIPRQIEEYYEFEKAIKFSLLSN